jgi:hypothetical protein
MIESGDTGLEVIKRGRRYGGDGFLDWDVGSFELGTGLTQKVRRARQQLDGGSIGWGGMDTVKPSEVEQPVRGYEHRV